MLIKSYEIRKKNLSSLNLFLIYGENIGLVEDTAKSVLGFKENKKGEYKQFEFEEDEIIKNQNNFFNLIFSGSLFDVNNYRPISLLYLLLVKSLKN